MGKRWLRILWNQKRKFFHRTLKCACFALMMVCLVMYVHLPYVPAPLNQTSYYILGGAGKHYLPLSHPENSNPALGILQGSSSLSLSGSKPRPLDHNDQKPPTQSVSAQRERLDLRFSHEDWQRANPPGDSDKLLVYSAFWDERLPPRPLVRVIAVMRLSPSPPVHCLLHAVDGKSVLVPATKKPINEHWKLAYAAFLVTCEVPPGFEQVGTVTVTPSAKVTEGATLLVRHNKEDALAPRGRIAVCVKPLHNEYDRATWLIEFVEFYRMMGVDHFFLYNHTTGPHVDTLLRHYIRDGAVTILPWTLDVTSQKEIRTEGLFAALNDCLFRTMHLFSYTVLLDFDEYIIPRVHDNYIELLRQLEDESSKRKFRPGSFVFKNAFFYLYWENDTSSLGGEPESPPRQLPYLLTQYKTRRVRVPHQYGVRSKYIIVPDRVQEVGNHFVWKHLNAFGLNVPERLALLHHYRICEHGGFECLKLPSKVDRSGHKFGDDLLRRVESTCRRVFGGSCPRSPPLGSPW